jgi:hypothetical protein
MPLQDLAAAGKSITEDSTVLNHEVTEPLVIKYYQHSDLLGALNIFVHFSHHLIKITG